MTLKQLSIEEHKKMIDKMNHPQMAHTYRFAHSGHPYFTNRELYDYFMERFNSKGGMTTSISKQIGWDIQNK